MAAASEEYSYSSTGSVDEPGSYSENDASDATSGDGESSEDVDPMSMAAAEKAHKARTGHNSSAPTLEDLHDADEEELLAAIRMPEINDGEELRSAFRTVNPFLPEFTPEGDAAMLQEALGLVKGKKKNELMLVDLLTTREPEQVQAARAVFNASNKKPLVKMIQKKTRSSFKRLMCGLVLSPAEFDTQQLVSAMSGIGTKESVVMEVLTTRSNAQIAAINEEFVRSYSKTLVRAIKGDTGGKFGKLMALLASGQREEDDLPLDLEAVHEDALALFEALENRRGSDDKVLIRIFGGRSHKHLKAVSRHYRKVTQQMHRRGQSVTHHFDELIEKKTSGDFRKSIKALINPEELLAKSVRRAVKGLGTDDALLRRTMLAARLTPIRLHLAKHAYLRLFDRAMIRDIEQDTSGNYRKAYRRLAATHTGNYLAVLLRENMRGSFHGIGTSKKKVTYILTEACSNARERKDTADAYVLDYGRKLEKSLKTELSGNHAKFLIALSTQRATLDATAVRKAIKGVGSASKGVLTDIFTTRRQFEITRLKEEYNRLFDRDLEDDLSSKLSGKYKKVILGLLEANRTEGLTISETRADELAHQLYSAGEKKFFGTNDDVFIHIMTSYSPQDLTAIDVAYERARNKRLTVAIKKETSGEYRKLLMACVDPIAHTVVALYKTMKGLGTNDKELQRLLVHRPAAEIAALKAAYLLKYKKTLGRWIKGDTSGAYRKALLSYIGDQTLVPTEDDPVEEGEHTGSGDGMGGEDDGIEDYEGNPDFVRPPPTFDEGDHGASASDGSHRAAPTL